MELVMSNLGESKIGDLARRVNRTALTAIGGVPLALLASCSSGDHAASRSPIPATSAPNPSPAAESNILVPGSHHTEVAGSDMLIVSKPGTQGGNTKKIREILKGTAVVVDCYIIDPANDFHGATPYYHITSPPED